MSDIPRHSIGGLTGKFKKMAQVYKHFGLSVCPSLDFSDTAQINLYNHESIGVPLTEKNGFAFGKLYLNLQVNMWREDLRRGWLSKAELYADEKYPHWWLDSVLKTTYENATYNQILIECNQI